MDPRTRRLLVTVALLAFIVTVVLAALI